MPKNVRLALDEAVDETEASPLIPDGDSSDDENESPDGTTARLARTIGRIEDLAEHPRRLAAAIQRNPYRDLEQRGDAELEALGRRRLEATATAAAQVGAGQILARTGVPGLSQIPGAVNAGHTAEQARRLHAIANGFVEHNEQDHELKTTIANCANFKAGKAGGQGTAAVIGAGAAAAGAGAVLVAATGGLAIPAVAITAVAAVGGTAGGLAAKKGVQKVFDLRRAFNPAQAARTLTDHAVREADGPARQAARAALQALGLDLARLEGIPPDADEGEPSEERLALREYVKRLF